MLTNTHDIEEAVDGTYLVVKDTTLLQDYVDEGIDITTDLVSVLFELENSSGTIYSSVISTSDFLSYLRDVNGFRISAADLIPTGIFFTDGIYQSRITLTEDSTGGDSEHISISDDIFLANISSIVASQIKDSDWKILYNPFKYKQSSQLQKRYLLLSIESAASSGLLEDSEDLLNSLNKLCS